MKVVKEIFQESYISLTSKGILAARTSVEKLLGSILGCRPHDVYLFFEEHLTKNQYSEFKKLLDRRKESEPVEYILEKVSFYGGEFFVNHNVLIPRVETEVLVDLIIKKIEKMPLDGKVLWDLCTGSGCIGISLKKKFPKLEVICSDVCPEALKVAARNAIELQADVKFVLGNLFTPFIGKKCDFLVSNPPYVSSDEYKVLDKDVKGFEPKGALLAKDGGMNFYKRFAKDLFEYVNPQGQAFFEIGYNQKESIKNLFLNTKSSSQSFFKDYQGKDRFFFLELE